MEDLKLSNLFRFLQVLEDLCFEQTWRKEVEVNDSTSTITIRFRDLSGKIVGSIGTTYKAVFGHMFPGFYAKELFERYMRDKNDIK